MPKIQRSDYIITGNVLASESRREVSGIMYAFRMQERKQKRNAGAYLLPLPGPGDAEQRNRPEACTANAKTSDGPAAAHKGVAGGGAELAAACVCGGWARNRAAASVDGSQPWNRAEAGPRRRAWSQAANGETEATMAARRQRLCGGTKGVDRKPTEKSLFLQFPNLPLVLFTQE
jgi:hypothetical protein